MKYYEFLIDGLQAQWAFSPVRGKRDVISLWMKTIKVLLIYSDIDARIAVGRIVLVVSRMSRLFYVSADKIYSINFPFLVSEDEEQQLKFRTLNCLDIDNRITSVILALIEADKVLDFCDVAEFADPLLDACDTDQSIWELFRDLILAEDGYIRYDHDPDNINGHLHPLHHLDIFYTNSSTFKIGLRDHFTKDDLIDVLDPKTNCHYLTTV